MSATISQRLAPVVDRWQAAERSWAEGARAIGHAVGTGHEPDADSVETYREAAADIEAYGAQIRAVIWAEVALVLPGLPEPGWRVDPAAVGIQWINSLTLRWRLLPNPGVVYIRYDTDRGRWSVEVAVSGWRWECWRWECWGTRLWPLLLQLEHLSPEWREAYAAASAGGEP